MYAFKDPIICEAIDEMRKTMTERDLAPYLFTFEKQERDRDDDLFYEREEGRKEGLAKGQVESTIRVLSARLKDCPADFLEKVRQATDMAWLDRVFDCAVVCSSWAELKASLETK